MYTCAIINIKVFAKKEAALPLALKERKQMVRLWLLSPYGMSDSDVRKMYMHMHTHCIFRCILNNKNRHNVVEKTGINEFVQENFTSPAFIQYPRHKGKHLGAGNIMNEKLRWQQL